MGPESLEQHVNRRRTGSVARCANVLAELGQRRAATSAGGGKRYGLFHRVAVRIKGDAIGNDERRVIEGRALVPYALIGE